MSAPDLTSVLHLLRDKKPPRHDPWGEDEGVPPASASGSGEDRIGIQSWLVPALVMAAVGYYGISAPSLWADEFATWGMVTSSWDDMVSVLKRVDAIIGPYYALVHLFTDAIGSTSDLAIRLPSLIAMTGAAALVGVLGARLATPRTGLTAGLIFALLPSSARFAQEARAYALAIFVAVLATCFLVAALRSSGTVHTLVRWAGYVLTVALLGLLHPISLLLTGAHAWVVFAQYRRKFMAWGFAALLGVLPMLPLLRYGNAQKSQVSWIPTPTGEALLRFPGELVGAVTIALLLIGLSLFSLPLRRPTAIYTAWGVLPVPALFAAAQVTPLFLSRYLLFTLPAWALLGAVALGRSHVAWSVLGVVAVGALAVPAQLDIRKDNGHGDASRGLAGTVADGFQKGDGIVYGMTDPGGNWVGRDSIAHYTPEGRRPNDVLMTQPPRTKGALAATECPNVVKCIGGTSRLWIVRLGYQEDPLSGLDAGKENVIRSQYNVTQVWRPRGFTLALAVAKEAKQ